MSYRKRRPEVVVQREKRARRRRLLIIGGVVVLAALMVAAIVMTRPREVEGVIKVDDMGDAHTSAAPSSYVYNSRPPTSGPLSSDLAAWGEHSETVSEWLHLHNLLSGGVVMHYNCPDGCPQVVEELRSIMDEVGDNLLILHPYTNMDSRIAVTAWTRMITLDEVDRDRIIEFIEAYRGIDHHPR